MLRALSSVVKKFPARTKPVRGLGVALVAGLAGCGAPEQIALIEEGTVGSQRAPIVNGTPHDGYQAVGAITHGGSLCTATLVGLRTVLTAAHCVRPGRDHYFVAADRYWAASSVTRHPQYGGASRANNDVAVAILVEMPPITPAFISSKAPQQGQELTLVGYGATSQQGSGSGRKRVGKNSVAALTQSRIIISGSGGTTSNLCFGDSGGPTFATIDGHEVQVGIHSTIAGTCGTQGHDMRVDVYSNWIKDVASDDVSVDGKPSPLLDAAPPSVKIDSPLQGSTVRQRFDLKVTATDDQRVARVDVIVSGEVVASRDVEPYLFQLELSPGEQQIAVVAYDAVDKRGQADVSVTVLPPAVFGESCIGHTECASGLCAEFSEIDHLFCTQDCDDSAACPEGALCYSAGDRQVCGPPARLLPEPPAVQQDPTTTPTLRDGGCSLTGALASADVPGLWLALSLLLLFRRDVFRRPAPRENTRC